ncbi:MAG: NAD(P)-dependent oxidoreductase [Thermoleophilia bacterium]|nr:NAD(P)-dependent oxidoreductase [Thermoleophilia bacterium]
MTAVAVIGLGAMGSRVARRLLGAGHEVRVWNRTPERATDLVDGGAVAAATPAEAARGADAVLTIVADPAALQAVTEGPSGVSAGVAAGSTVIDMSTIGPAAIARLAAMLPEGTGLLDAPVLGSISEVETGSLTIFVGGPAPLVEQWTPLLGELGSAIRVGPLGAGAAAKLVANTTLFGTLGVLGEALGLADGLGLSRAAAWAVLAATPVGAQAERRREAIENGEFPPRFRLSLARKDADLILEAAETSRVDVRVTAAARTWLAEAEDAGWGGEDYAAVLAWILGRR